MSDKKQSVGDLASQLFMLGRAIRERFHDAKSGGCSFIQFETLRYVKDEERPLMRDVARYLFITPPAATLLIDGLVKEKLLLRMFDRKDRRAVRLELTSKGKKLLQKGYQRKTDHIKKIIASLTARERADLAQIVKKMIANAS